MHPASSNSSSGSSSRQQSGEANDPSKRAELEAEGGGVAAVPTISPISATAAVAGVKRVPKWEDSDEEDEDQKDGASFGLFFPGANKDKLDGIGGSGVIGSSSKGSSGKGRFGRLGGSDSGKIRGGDAKRRKQTANSQPQHALSVGVHTFRLFLLSDQLGAMAWPPSLEMKMLPVYHVSPGIVPLSHEGLSLPHPLPHPALKTPPYYIHVNIRIIPPPAEPFDGLRAR